MNGPRLRVLLPAAIVIGVAAWAVFCWWYPHRNVHVPGMIWLTPLLGFIMLGLGEWNRATIDEVMIPFSVFWGIAAIGAGILVACWWQAKRRMRRDPDGDGRTS